MRPGESSIQKGIESNREKKEFVTKKEEENELK
jgi:hypothetical protein